MPYRSIELRERSIAVYRRGGQKHFFIADLHYDYDLTEASFVLRGCVGQIRDVLLSEAGCCYITYDGRSFPVSKAFMYPTLDEAVVVVAQISPAYLPRVNHEKPVDQELDLDVPTRFCVEGGGAGWAVKPPQGVPRFGSFDPSDGCFPHLQS